MWFKVPQDIFFTRHPLSEQESCSSKQCLKLILEFRCLFIQILTCQVIILIKGNGNDWYCFGVLFYKVNAIFFTAILAANDEDNTPKVSLVRLWSLKGFWGLCLQTKRCGSHCSSGSRSALYMWLTSVVRAILFCGNLSNTSTRGRCKVGPTSSWSFSDIPEDEFTDASNTTLNHVVVLESFVLVAGGCS